MTYCDASVIEGPVASAGRHAIILADTGPPIQRYTGSHVTGRRAPGHAALPRTILRYSRSRMRQGDTG